MAENLNVTPGTGAVISMDEATVQGTPSLIQRVKLLSSANDSPEELSKAEDSPHTTGDHGIEALAVRKDTAAALSGSDGDYTPLITDANGRLHVILPSTSVGGGTSLPTGGNLIGSVNVDTVPADPLGANADAAVTGDATGSINAHLRGLLKTVGDIVASPATYSIGDRLKALLTGISLAAGEAHLGEVGKKITTVIASLTRPSDTNVYAAGDAVTDSVTAPTYITFSSVSRIAAGSATIVNAFLIDSANQATKPNLELWLYDTAPTAQNDNSAFTPSDSELANLIGVIVFDGANAWAGDPTVGAGGNLVTPGTFGGSVNSYSLLIPSGSAIFGLLVARNAYTPVSAEVFKVRLVVNQN